MGVNRVDTGGQLSRTDGTGLARAAGMPWHSTAPPSNLGPGSHHGRRRLKRGDPTHRRLRF
ncbi:MAG: hypothetical protein ACE5E8_09565, partial [Acidimicrobiia bacterium]